MTLNETILQRLAEWQPPSERSTLTIDPGQGCAVTVTADRNEELGCLAWEVSLRWTAAPDVGLKECAGNRAERITGLLEPLKVIEIDAQRNEAMLRSEKPTRRGNASYYYELMLSGTTEARLCRYQAAAHGSERKQVLFPITHEALAKVVSGLIEA